MGTNSKSKPHRTAFTLIDLLTIILIICLLSGIVLSQGIRARESSSRISCASNLKQIGLAIQLYGNENKGAYPRTLYKPGDPLTQYTGFECKDPFGKENTPKFNDITAAMFLLLRTQDFKADSFVCPSTDAQPFKYPDHKSVQDYANFKSEQNLSYSFINVYPDQAVVKAGYKTNATTTSEIAIMADMNPGTFGEFDVTPKTGPKDQNAPAEIIRKANSMNHRGTGQNVLYGDGHCEFKPTPFCGMKNDNIYTVATGEDSSKTTSQTIAASPTWPGDSVLLPPATASPVKAKPANEELLKLHEDLVHDRALIKVELGIEQLRNGKTESYNELKDDLTDREEEIAATEAQMKKANIAIPPTKKPLE